MEGSAELDAGQKSLDGEAMLIVTVLRCMTVASQVPQASLGALVAMALDGVPIDGQDMALSYILECHPDEVKQLWGILAESEPGNLDRDWHQALTYDLVRVRPLKGGYVVLYEPYWDI